MFPKCNIVLDLWISLSASPLVAQGFKPCQFSCAIEYLWCQRCGQMWDKNALSRKKKKAREREAYVVSLFCQMRNEGIPKVFPLHLFFVVHQGSWGLCCISLLNWLHQQLEWVLCNSLYLPARPGNLTPCKNASNNHLHIIISILDCTGT